MAQDKITRGKTISLEPANWEFPQEKVKFEKVNGISSIRFLTGDATASLKNYSFSTGTIEYDVLPVTLGFTGVYFRKASNEEMECVYLRAHNAGDNTAPYAIQYAPFLKGVNLWDLLPQFQAAATIFPDKPNHVKIVVSQNQLLAFVNNMNEPALRVSRMEGDSKKGTIAFDGNVVVSNVRISEDVLPELDNSPAADLTLNDPNYIRSFQVSEPSKLPYGTEPWLKTLPDSSARWTEFKAERAGLVNLTRLHGPSTERRLIWLRVVINAVNPGKRKISMGFSDEVWVYINRKLLFADKNIFPEPIRKFPDGRISLENSSFQIPLNAGKNELLIAVANDFYGWGLIARLESLDGIQLGR